MINGTVNAKNQILTSTHHKLNFEFNLSHKWHFQFNYKHEQKNVKKHGLFGPTNVHAKKIPRCWASGLLFSTFSPSF